jgi:DNA invertase Pin-like site-specific DNA recombinase
MVLIEEFDKAGCKVEFVERPMSSEPNDQLLLQIRGAVAEYERTLLSERMRRGEERMGDHEVLEEVHRPGDLPCLALLVNREAAADQGSELHLGGGRRVGLDFKSVIGKICRVRFSHAC